MNGNLKNLTMRSFFLKLLSIYRERSNMINYRSHFLSINYQWFHEQNPSVTKRPLICVFQAENVKISNCSQSRSEISAGSHFLENYFHVIKVQKFILVEISTGSSWFWEAWTSWLKWKKSKNSSFDKEIQLIW